MIPNNCVAFISDLHLSPNNLELFKLFEDFCNQELIKAKQVFILGDLFDLYVGYDINPAWYNQVANIFANIAKHNTEIFLIAGNRDFLLDEAFLKAAKITRLNDPSFIEFNNKRVILTHGDLFCTQDKLYQAYRKLVQSNFIKNIFLKLPKTARNYIANKLRKTSKNYQAKQALPKLDVHEPAFYKLLTQTDHPDIIHGHTHRPNIHQMRVNGKLSLRIVLGSWSSNSGNCLIAGADNYQLIFFDEKLNQTNMLGAPVAKTLDRDHFTEILKKQIVEKINEQMTWH